MEDGKIKNGLEHCSGENEKRCNSSCPYYKLEFCESKLANDALKLIEEQENTIETQRDIIKAQEEQILYLETDLYGKSTN